MFATGLQGISYMETLLKMTICGTNLDIQFVPFLPVFQLFYSKYKKKTFKFA